MTTIPSLIGFFGNINAGQIRVIPTNTATPIVSGTAQVGQTLTCSTGAWTGPPISYAYQWKAGATFVGTNQSFYVVQPSDVGKTITCTVTATTTTGDTASATSPTTATVVDTPGPLPDPGGGTTGTLAIGSRLILIGDSNTQWDYAGNGYSRRILMYTGGRFRVPVGGNRGAQGTQTSYGVSDISYVLSRNPDVVTIMYGTNDGTNSSAIISGYDTMINAYKAAGIRVVAIGTPQRQDGSTNTAVAAVNAALAARADVLDGTVKHIDPSTLFTAAEVTGGTHLGEGAHDKLARGVAAALNSLAVADDVYSQAWSDNVYANWFNGTGGSLTTGFSGVLPNGFVTQNVGNSTSTVLCEKVVRNGRNTLKLTYTNPGAGFTGLGIYWSAPTPSAFAAGSVCDSVVRIQFAGDSPDQIGIYIGGNRDLMKRPYTLDVSLTPEEIIWRGETESLPAQNYLASGIVLTGYGAAKQHIIYLSEPRARLRTSD